jgi:Tol biopolymer transport system component
VIVAARILFFVFASLALLAAPAASELHAAMVVANGRIAFVSTRDGTSEIYTMNADGTEQTRLTVNPAEDVSPAWSPDGKRIAFASNRDGDWNIYTINRHGAALRRLTDASGFDGNPSWSPDGTQIAFASSRDGNSEIYVMNADGTDQTRLTDSPADDAMPAWAPDSKACGSHAAEIGFESDRGGNYEIYAVHPDGSDLENLTENPAPDFDPSWAPDCSAIAFDRVTAGDYDIYTLDLATRTTTRLTSSPREDSRPSWSPDGKLIAFTSLRDGHYEIYLTGATGEAEQIDLSSSFPNTDIQPAWQATKAPAQPSGQAFAPQALRRAANPPPPQVTCGIGPAAGSVIRGTPSADVICSGANSQTLLGKPGNDTFIDDGGRDTIYGGPGKDVINAKDGAKDVIWGGPGVDQISIDRFDEVRKPTGDAIYK